LTGCETPTPVSALTTRGCVTVACHARAVHSGPPVQGGEIAETTPVSALTTRGCVTVACHARAVHSGPPVQGGEIAEIGGNHTIIYRVLYSAIIAVISGKLAIYRPGPFFRTTQGQRRGRKSLDCTWPASSLEGGSTKGHPIAGARSPPSTLRKK
jgi:hypothetical protein